MTTLPLKSPLRCEPLLAIPHRVEEFPGGCLVACCQMALAYLGVTVSQSKIARRLGHISGAGTRARNIVRLSRYGVDVRYAENGTVEDLRYKIHSGAIVIAFVRTGELPYWEKDVPHAVIVVAMEADIVYLNDPSFESAPIPIPLGDFLLALGEFGNQWAWVSQPLSHGEVNFRERG